ncbi:MAG: hypothetical protein HXX17_01430 [Geobacteraceae bacterium]|nr:hypothetical protein [Geobacteraceae bacterium]
MDPTSMTASTVTLSQFTGAKAVAAGYSHTVVLRNDGTVVAWGNNSFLQTAVPTGLAGVAAIAAGDAHSLALKNDGTVVAWGRNDYLQTTVPGGLTGVTAISAGFGHSLALKNDGTVVAWGLNADGQATVPSGLTNIVAIAAGGYHSLALTADGTVVAWGRNIDYGQATVPSSLTGVIAIAAGWHSSTALRGNGTIVSWGEGSTDKAGLTNIVAIAAGAYHKVALKSDGTVVAWGDNSYGQSSVPAPLGTVADIAAGAYNTLVLQNDDTPVAWGRSDYSQSSVPVNAANTLIAGTVSYEPASKTVAFTPTAQLPAPAVIKATISSAVKNSQGVNLGSDYTWTFITSATQLSPVHYNLTVSLAGSGSGSVYADVSGTIACIKGSSAGCSGDFPVSLVNLIVAADWKSIFSGWSGSCVGMENCQLYMDRTRNITATFTANNQVVTNGNLSSGFATLQEAYNSAADSGLIQTHVYTFYEDLLFNQLKTVTLDGGKDINDQTYQSTIGFTTVQGSMTVGSGTVVISNFIISSK